MNRNRVISIKLPLAAVSNRQQQQQQQRKHGLKKKGHSYFHFDTS